VDLISRVWADLTHPIAESAAEDVAFRPIGRRVQSADFHSSPHAKAL